MTDRELDQLNEVAARIVKHVAHQGYNLGCKQALLSALEAYKGHYDQNDVQCVLIGAALVLSSLMEAKSTLARLEVGGVLEGLLG